MRVTEGLHRIATTDELASLSVRLMHEYVPRFNAANLWVSIGRVRSLIRRGIGLEINGEWDSFTAARWSLFRRRWVLVKGLADLEATVRAYLDAAFG
jgi:hypothetical protein